MKDYSVPGFKVSFPKSFKRRGDFPYLTITNHQTRSTVSIILLNRSATYADEFKIKLEPTNVWRTQYDCDPAEDVGFSMKRLHEVIRSGNYAKFPGAIERLSKSNIQNVQIFYHWAILIPINNRLIEVRGMINALEGPAEMDNLWQPIIDSMEFDQDIIDDLPDLFEKMANAKKIEFISDILKISYPEKCKYKNGTITNISTKGSLEIAFFPPDVPGGRSMYGLEYDIRVNPKSIENNQNQQEKLQIIRAGNYDKFPNGKELLRRTIFNSGHVEYLWTVLMQVENRAIRIQTLSKDLSEIEYLWKPIVDSMELNYKNVGQLFDPECKPAPCNWEKTIIGQTQHFHIGFTGQDHFVGLSGLNGSLFTESEIDDCFDCVVNLVEEKWNKIDERLLLYIATDPLEIPVDFYLNTDSPDENDPTWDQVIEGFINCSVGKLFASSSMGADAPSLEITLPQKGIYKFRIYYGGLDYKLSEVGEHWQIYLWPTDETIESNEIKVIKVFKRAG